MREVTFFWKINRVEHLDIGLVVKIFRRIEFLSYVKRVPKDVSRESGLSITETPSVP